MTAGAGVFSASADIFRRNLLHLRRTPNLLVSSLVQPALFALLLGFVFSGSLGGQSYREYIVAGLLAQTVVFTASFTAVGLARDLQEGVVDRFRTLPIPRISVLLGRTTSDLVTTVISIMVTASCGLLLGWRPHNGVADAVAAVALILVFAFAMSWIGAFIAVVSPNSQVAGSLGLIWLFPATFVSSGFVVTTTLPAPLDFFARWSPISALNNALRLLFGNAPPPGYADPHDWVSGHPVLCTITYSVLLVAVFAALSTWCYRRRTNR